jgi:hypothetical protein
MVNILQKYITQNIEHRLIFLFKYHPIYIPALHTLGKYNILLVQRLNKHRNRFTNPNFQGFTSEATSLAASSRRYT